jgi:hypothetical protein
MPKSRRWGPRPTPGAGPGGAGPSSDEDMAGDGAGFEHPTAAGQSSEAEPSYRCHDPDTFSPLLWTHHVKHRVSLASLEVRDYYA